MDLYPLPVCRGVVQVTDDVMVRNGARSSIQGTYRGNTIIRRSGPADGPRTATRSRGGVPEGWGAKNRMIVAELYVEPNAVREPYPR